MPAQSRSKHVCPITKTAELLSDTWTMLIMRALTESPKRFSELERWLEDISTRTLAQKLKTLMAEGLVVKDTTGTYRPTRKGMGLKSIERAMAGYARRYLGN